MGVAAVGGTAIGAAAYATPYAIAGIQNAAYFLAACTPFAGLINQSTVNEFNPYIGPTVGELIPYVNSFGLALLPAPNGPFHTGGEALASGLGQVTAAIPDFIDYVKSKLDNVNGSAATGSGCK
jgi:hypothetical protein